VNTEPYLIGILEKDAKSAFDKLQFDVFSEPLLVNLPTGNVISSSINI
jgi:hypothetical protein